MNEPLILFNGATGGIGKHLGDAAANRGLETRTLSARVEDKVATQRALDTVAPEDHQEVTLIHLAALVSVKVCESEPARAHAINVGGATTAVEVFSTWAHSRSISPRVVLVSTGHVYGATKPGELIDEDHPTDPQSVYARSKYEAELAVLDLSRANGVPVQVARVFGLIGPNQRPQYLLPGLMSRIDRRDVGAVPGLLYTRDYLDTRDVADHLAVLAQLRSNTSRIVNVCSGEETTIEQLLSVAIEFAPLTSRERGELEALVGPAPGRPSDAEWVVGNPDRLKSLGVDVLRRTPIEATVRDAWSRRMETRDTNL